jgi:hypothetical protein
MNIEPQPSQSQTFPIDPNLIGARAIYLAVAMMGYEDHGPRDPEAARRYHEHAIELTAMLSDRTIRAGLSGLRARHRVVAELCKNAMLGDYIRRNRAFHFPELDALMLKMTSQPSGRDR